MSRNRRERNPSLACDFEWADAHDRCPHVCRLRVAEHGDFHECCRAQDGRIEVDA